MSVRPFNKALFALCFLVHLSHAQAQSQSGHMGHHTDVPACEGSPLHCANSATPLFTADGRLLLAFISNGSVYFSDSADSGRHLSEPVLIDHKGKHLDSGADARASLAVDTRGRIALAFSYFKDENWNAQVLVAHSSDGGKTFSTPHSVSQDAASQRFGTLLSIHDRILAVWLDKRSWQASKQENAKPIASIAYAWSDDGGATFGKEYLGHEGSCECCRLALASAPDGTPTLAFRAIFDGHVRDTALMAIAENTPDSQFRRVSTDDWETDSCPHHGPALGFEPSGQLHVAWFTQGKNRQGIYYANETKSGTFSTPVSLGNPLNHPGRPSIASNHSRVWLAWKEFDGKAACIYAMSSNDHGNTWSASKPVSCTSGYSDHPILIEHNNHVFLSWLTRDDGYQLKDLDL